MSDTIAAIATGNIISAIGILRISGPSAVSVADAVFTPFRGVPMAQRRDRTLVYGELHDSEGRVIDHCLCTISHAPNTYTGEDTAELQCHGSPVVLREGLESLFSAGARQALAGEFTRRAFLNGRMDLTQAEAVIDLIDAETAQCARNAAGQLGGAVSRKTDEIYDLLKDISAHFHAVIDYPDEDIEPFELEEYESSLATARETLERLLRSFERGKIMRTGLPTAIIGLPNAGKSSLLNKILGYDRAIVTDIPGTTRDTLSERAVLGGITLLLTDTAGLRDSDDYVEQLGVERSRRAIEESELVITVLDGTKPVTKSERELIESSSGVRHHITVRTRSDLPEFIPIEGMISVSCVTGDGLLDLEKAISEMFPTGMHEVPGEILTNVRHAEAVSHALENISAALDAMKLGVTPDAVLTETESAMEALGELTGKTVREDITNRIFERFCVGK